MKKKLIYLLFGFILFQISYSQNTFNFTPLSQKFASPYGVNVFINVKVTCEGTSNVATPLNLTICDSDSAFISTSYSNGNQLLPGQSTTITFKFFKSNSLMINYPEPNHTALYNYKFSVGNNCSSENAIINIRGIFSYDSLRQLCNVGQLECPSNLNITNIGTNSISFSWSSVYGATKYYLTALTGGLGVRAGTQMINSTNTTIQGLVEGTNYEISLQALNEDGGCNTGGGGLKFKVKTLCTIKSPPLNITATPYGSNGYVIGFQPAGACTMEYIDLVNGTKGTTTVYTSSNPGDNLFYYIPQNHNFKFRLTKLEPCAVTSDWVTISSDICQPTNYPTNLFVSNPCSYPSRYCGYGALSWTAIQGISSYSIEYNILSLSNPSQNIIGTASSYTNSSTIYNSQASNFSSPVVIKFRVKSQCPNATLSNFSPWSSNFVW
jgi:hypothetical protein